MKTLKFFGKYDGSFYGLEHWKLQTVKPQSCYQTTPSRLHRLITTGSKTQAMQWKEANYVESQNLTYGSCSVALVF